MSDTSPTVPLGQPAARGRARGRVAWVVVAVAVLLAGAALLASNYAKGYFLFSPGTAPVITASGDCRSSNGQLALPDGTPCVHLVVPKSKAHNLDGKLLMVDVEVSTPGPLDWARYELGLLGKQQQLVPVQDYAGITPTSELACQDTQQMVSANQDAALAALSRLHYHVTEVPLGAQVVGVLAATPAWQAGIRCNDLITALDGTPVKDAAQFTALLAPLPASRVVVLTDLPASGGPVEHVRVRLARTPAARVAEGFPKRAYLGVSVETRSRPELPFPISVQAGDIGGPSAGLAFTLAILDALSGGGITGGHVVAATGTIAPDGVVGDVGGVQEKTVAVEKAGAQVFFVPVAEYPDAKSVASKQLQVFPVSTLNQVLGILHKKFGGSLPGAR